MFKEEIFVQHRHWNGRLQNRASCNEDYLRCVSIQNGKRRNIDDPVLSTKVDKERWCKD